MPIFEYICRKCGHEFEQLVRKSSENKEIQCPECRSTNLEEKISGFASLSTSSGLGASNCTPSGG